MRFLKSVCEREWYSWIIRKLFVSGVDPIWECLILRWPFKLSIVFDTHWFVFSQVYVLFSRTFPTCAGPLADEWILGLAVAVIPEEALGYPASFRRKHERILHLKLKGQGEITSVISTVQDQPCLNRNYKLALLDTSLAVPLKLDPSNVDLASWPLKYPRTQITH